MQLLESHFDLRVYQSARAVAIKVSGIVNILPADERFDMAQQWRRSSRSVCSNIAEAWRKRRYPGAFVSKLNDAEAEAAEAQTWADLAEGYGYLSRQVRDEIIADYERVIGQLVKMIKTASKWTFNSNPPAPAHAPTRTHLSSP